MKKAFTKALAALLAALLLLGACAVGASAAPRKKPMPSQRAAALAAESNSEGTLTITAPGKAEAMLYEYYEGEYWPEYLDLGGLVFEASGGKLAAPQTINYDDLDEEENRYKPQVGKTVWYAWIEYDEQAQPGGWKLGANQAILYVQAYLYTKFVPVKVIGGIEYGEFEEELVFDGKAPITITGVKYESSGGQADIEDAAALTLGAPAKFDVSGYDAWYKFTPDETGYYAFVSNGAQGGDWLWTEDGQEHSVDGIDPYAELYDKDGKYLIGNDDGDDLNFKILYKLEKGKTYYLYVGLCYRSDVSEGECTITVEKTNERPPSKYADLWNQILYRAKRFLSGRWIFGWPSNRFEIIRNIVLNLPLLLLALPALPFLVILLLTGKLF